jgi:alpha-1,3-rhamnosyltransferase
MNDLVSIVIITYRSSEYIVETLNSIKNQTYKNIELIITDDCSPDDTVSICNKWLDVNSKYFVRTKLITSDINTGIAPNTNRGFRESKGSWIKFLAGDDLLAAQCIEKNINYVKNNQSANVVFSKAQIFTDKKGTKIYKNIVPNDNDLLFFDLSVEQKFHSLLGTNFLPAPTAFIRSEIYKKYPNDEDFPFLEDKPEWLLLLYNGINFSFMNEVTVLYRISSSNISVSNEHFFNPTLNRSRIIFYYKKMIDYYNKDDGKLYDEYRKSLFMLDVADGLLHNNKASFFNRCLFFLINKIVNKIFYYDVSIKG